MDDREICEKIVKEGDCEMSCEGGEIDGRFCPLCDVCYFDAGIVDEAKKWLDEHPICNQKNECESCRSYELINEDIDAFVSTMRFKLSRNDFKGYWGDMPCKELYGLLLEEICELFVAIDNEPSGSIQKEAADVGNIAMMIHSVARRSS